MADGAPTIATMREGLEASRTYTISPEVYEAFLVASGDVNPLHVDDEHARRLGFPEKVMHGAILGCFISHFVGMHFPAGAVVLQSLDTQLKSPCHLHDQVRIDARVTQVAEAVGAVVMSLVLTNETRGRVAAKARVQVGLR
ncbi:hypothetical protein K2Z84_09800 [Candidatus Binatia bacterium]|nr:hypothetical protein [Candidatus Binatia bacterium]